jgi:hypothetical protein
MSAATANTVPISWWKEPTKNQIPTDRAFSSGLRPPSVFLALLPIRVFPAPCNGTVNRTGRHRSEFRKVRCKAVAPLASASSRKGSARIR